jgi:virginiamycin A acetyltransferase
MSQNIHATTKMAGNYYFTASEHSPITIGKYCAIANNVTIQTLNHDYVYPALQGTFYKNKFDSRHPGEIQQPPNRTRTKGGVIIGNDVLISQGVWVGGGVSIGDGAII